MERWKGRREEKERRKGGKGKRGRREERSRKRDEEGEIKGVTSHLTLGYATYTVVY